MATTYKLRRDTSGRWERVNPILEAGEPGFERDTGRLKIGDGVTRWNDLPSFIPAPEELEDLAPELLAHIEDPEPHPNYDDGRSFELLYQNAKV